MLKKKKQTKNWPELFKIGILYKLSIYIFTFIFKKNINKLFQTFNLNIYET